MKKDSIIFLDGALGTMLQARGLQAGETPEDWNLTHADEVLAIHSEYANAGADIICANTFGANSLKYHGSFSVREVAEAGMKLAREAAGGKRVALDVGPTGRLLKPFGDLDFERAVGAFSETIRIGADAGADLILVETMGDTLELKAAIVAAKENCNLPVMATVALSEGGKLLTGADIDCVATLLESLDVSAYGFNCGIGPDLMLAYVERLARISSKPIIVKPNAGIPRVENGKTVFDIAPEEFARHAVGLVKAGAVFVGGCCGTTPAHISAVRHALESLDVRPELPPAPGHTAVSGSSGAIVLRSGDGLIIGERINPTGKKRLKEAYLKGDTAYVLREAVSQIDAGAAILDINCGVPGIDETSLLPATVDAVQSVTNLPVQIDTADPAALKAALRRINGKALVNSVNGKRESMDSVFPLVKLYGGTLVALCLDENGIPDTAGGRIAIARKILDEGAKYGLRKKDFVFDALTLAVSADANAALVTIETVRRLTQELGVNTVLGVSNVSFALPDRPALNNAMYTLAKRAGLSAAIANPSAIAESADQAAFDVLLGRDPNCERWIARCQREEPLAPAVQTGNDAMSMLRQSIMRGLKDDARSCAEQVLAEGVKAMAIIERAVIPALEEIGRGFEASRVFLPQLLMSADAAGAAFETVKATLGSNCSGGKGRPIVLATVKGDIHDIGKNIVRALLENYGFDVIDLGRDVAPETIVETAKRTNAMMIGLSALMTTTVGAMAETVAALKRANLDCKTCVGGAVVTQDYADGIGADFYAKDAMRTVRIAESLLAENAPAK